MRLRIAKKIFFNCEYRYYTDAQEQKAARRYCRYRADYANWEWRRYVKFRGKYPSIGNETAWIGI